MESADWVSIPDEWIVMDDNEFYKERAEDCLRISNIPPDLYDAYDVKKGLRDKDGNGVRAGITNISKVIGVNRTGDGSEPCDGRLSYRGYDIRDIVLHHGDSGLRFDMRPQAPRDLQGLNYLHAQNFGPIGI